MLTTIYIVLFLAGCVGGGFLLVKLFDGPPNEPWLPAPNDEVPRLPCSNGGPYRTTESTDIVPADSDTELTKPLSEEKIFDKILMAQHCLEPDDSQLKEWANLLSADFLISNLKCGQDEAAILSFQLRNRAEDAIALKKLANTDSDRHKRYIVQSLRGNASREAILLLVDMLSHTKDFIVEQARESLDVCEKERLLVSMHELLLSKETTIVTQGAIIRYLETDDANTEALTETLISKLKRNDLDQFMRSSAAKYLSRLPGGKEKLRQLLN